MKNPFLATLITAGLFSASDARAEVRMPPLFGDHMVLQQDAKLPVWGWAEPGEEITVVLAAQQLKTMADANGNWRVDFAPLPTASSPVVLTIQGKNSITIQDVLVGEVWLASGQSNMAFSLGWNPDWKDQLPQPGDPPLRFFSVDGHPSVRARNMATGHWRIVTAETGDVSAVGYYFARQLGQKLNRPVGVIGSYWGGTAIESWSSAEALAKIPGKAASLEQMAKKAAEFPRDPKEQEATLAAFHERDAEWDKDFQRPYIAAHEQWAKDRDAAKAEGKPIPAEPSYPSNRPRNPEGEADEYTTLFNGMIYPLMPYAIKGAIWYQGEANSGMNNQYDLMLASMVTDWRAGWGTNFTFLPVTLANIGERFPTPTDNGWAEVRDDEEKVCAELPKAGTAEAIDLGTAHNIHPSDKIDIGKRLSAQALRIAYGQNIVSSGPRFEAMAGEGNKIRIKWRDAGSGLKLAVSPFVSNDPPNENPALPIDRPLSFDIAGADRKWAVAQAQLDGNEVLVWSDAVPNPVAVRYGWAQNPQINLYNQEGFPAVPFRTQTWPAEAR